MSESQPLLADALLPSHAEDHSSELSKYIKDVVYGGLDGIVSIFVTVAASAGVSVGGHSFSWLNALVLCLAKLIAGALSMAVGDWLATDAESALAAYEQRREIWEYDNNPEGEIAEMVELYVKKGVPEDTARRIMAILGKHKHAFIDIMMVEELGIPPDAKDESPTKHALATFVSFGIFGAVPLVAYLVAAILQGHYGWMNLVPFFVSAGATLLTLVLMGIVKAQATGTGLVWSAVVTVLLGALTAGVGWGTAFGLDWAFPQNATAVNITTAPMYY
jgi:VIT1/CCC1 family predicted Fe2+/Mn2+ transporter